MTKYTFICTECGEEFVESRRFGDSSPPRCPNPDCRGMSRVKITPPLSIKLGWKPSIRQPALTRPNRER